MKKIILGFTFGIITMLGVTVLAGNGISKNIQAHYNVNEIVIDGVKTGKGNQAFISSGTTYVPLRAISDGLGCDVSWDNNTKTITINSNKNNITVNPSDTMPTDLPLANNTTATKPQAQPPVQIQVQPQAQPPVQQQPVKTYIGEAKAREIALSKAGGGQVISFEADLHERVPHYDVDVLKGTMVYDVEINATTGAIVKFEYESIYD